MEQPQEFMIKLPAMAIQAILDVLDQAPMPQRVSRPITDLILKQINEQANPPAGEVKPAAADAAPAADTEAPPDQPNDPT